MKILFLYLKGFSQVGGIEKFNRAFMKGLNDHSEGSPGLSFSAVSLYDKKPDLKYIDKEYFYGCNGNKIHFLSKSLFLILRSDKIILGHINLSLIGVIAKFLGKKVILIAHGIEVWNEESPIKNHMLNNADLILSVSRYTKSRMLEQNSIDPERILIFPNTLDPYFNSADSAQSAEIPGRYGIKPGSKIILTVSRLSSKEKYKGYEKVINVLPELKKTFPGFGYLIVGGGDDTEINRIKNIIKDLNLEDEVVLAGQVVDDELNEIYGSADVFIMPSLGEGFGIVFLEALANGLPVIAGNKDGSADPLMDGKLGILVDPDSPDQILKALTDTLNENISNKLLNKDYLKTEVEANFGFSKFKKKLNEVLKLII